jgi:hypothetical protein
MCVGKGLHSAKLTQLGGGGGGGARVERFPPALPV